MSDLFALFPTPIYRINLSNHKEFKKKSVPKLVELFKKEPNKKSKWAIMCHTWQAGFNDIVPNYFECIQKEIDVAIEEYCRFLGLPPFRYEKTGWFNIHDSNMYQEVHNHIPAIFSGIYYIQFDKTKDSQVLFKNPSETFLSLMAGSKVPINNPMLLQNTLFDNNFILEEGDVVLFPASLDHLVPKAKHPHDGLRITLSFNVTPITSVNAIKEWKKED